MIKAKILSYLLFLYFDEFVNYFLFYLAFLTYLTSSLFKLKTINDKKDYQVVNAAMRATKLSLDDCNVIWKLLAGILHLVSLPSA